jgi:hypothetical protein
MKPFIDKINPNVNLKKGEYLCKPCNGWGRILNEDSLLRTPFLKCPVCLGDGKLDWIENIVGKQEENIQGENTWRPRAVTGVIVKNEPPNPKKGMKFYDMDKRCLKVFDGKDWIIETSTT